MEYETHSNVWSLCIQWFLKRKREGQEVHGRGQDRVIRHDDYLHTPYEIFYPTTNELLRVK